jgi:hypothetical protein
MPAETVVVQAFWHAVSGRPEGLHYFRRFLHSDHGPPEGGHDVLNNQ